MFCLNYLLSCEDFMYSVNMLEVAPLQRLLSGLAYKVICMNF